MKDKIRSVLSPKMTTAIVRLHHSEDTVFTLDVARLTRMWVANGHTLCDEPSNWQKTRLRHDRDEAEVDPTIVDLEFLYGGEDDGPKPVTRDTNTCIIIINKMSGEILSAVRNAVKLQPYSSTTGISNEMVIML